jgi:hypothetical protein
MALAVAKPTIQTGTPPKDATIVTTLPSSFDIDLEKNTHRHNAHLPSPTTSSEESCSSTESLDKEQIPPLPPKRHTRIFRHFRYTFFNVYRRLFSIVFVLNLIGVAILFGKYKGANLPEFLADLANAASANIMVAIAMRQDYIINICYRSVYHISIHDA